MVTVLGSAFWFCLTIWCATGSNDLLSATNTWWLIDEQMLKHLHDHVSCICIRVLSLCSQSVLQRVCFQTTCPETVSWWDCFFRTASSRVVEGVCFAHTFKRSNLVTTSPDCFLQSWKRSNLVTTSSDCFCHVSKKANLVTTSGDCFVTPPKPQRHEGYCFNAKTDCFTTSLIVFLWPEMCQRHLWLFFFVCKTKEICQRHLWLFFVKVHFGQRRSWLFFCECRLCQRHAWLFFVERCLRRRHAWLFFILVSWWCLREGLFRKHLCWPWSLCKGSSLAKKIILGKGSSLAKVLPWRGFFFGSRSSLAKVLL